MNQYNTYIHNHHPGQETTRKALLLFFSPITTPLLPLKANRYSDFMVISFLYSFTT